MSRNIRSIGHGVLKCWAGFRQYGLRVCLLIALGGGAAACGLAKSESPRDTYDITAPNLSGVGGSTRAQILVKVPTALKSIDSDRIILKPSPSVITYLSGAQWSDTVPKLIQARLVEAFENTGSTGATAKPGDGLVIDYQLVGDIRKFEISEGSAVIEISIKLLSDSSGRVRQTRIFKAVAGAAGSENEDYVAAFDTAFDQVSRDVIRWVLRQI